jgi:hypothetical protein
MAEPYGVRDGSAIAKATTLGRVRGAEGAGRNNHSNTIT